MIRTISLATLLWALSAIAETPSPLITVGTTATCGDWYAERQGRGQYSWQTEVVFVQGFISGHNVYAQPPETPTIPAEPDDIIPSLDSYCQKYPTNNLVQAAAAYVTAHGGRDALGTPRSK